LRGSYVELKNKRYVLIRGLNWEISMISFNCLMYSDARYLAAISKWSSLQYDNAKECLTNSSNIWNVGCLKISDRQETIILSLKLNNSRSSHSSNSFCLILYLPHISSMTNIWRLSDTFFMWTGDLHGVI
jgi:hypothetical protein